MTAPTVPTNASRSAGAAWLALAWIVSAASGCGESANEESLTAGPARVEAGAPRQTALPSPAFFEAALAGDRTAIERELENGVDVESTNDLGSTVLMLAAFNGHDDLVRSILGGGAAIDQRDLTGRTALMYASSGPFPATVRLLLENEADVNLTDAAEGWSAIMFAGGEGLTEVIAILLAHGADSQLKDEDGDTALTFARQNGHAEAAALLESAMRK